MTILENLQMRPATLDDAAAIVELINLCTMEEENVTSATVEEQRRGMERPHFNPATDTVMVFAPDGTLVGYGGVSSRPPHVAMGAWGRVHPDYRGQGIGTRMLAWTDERARQFIDQAPPGSRVSLFRNNTRSNVAAEPLLTAHGYTVTRYYWRMAIELDQEQPTPQWADGIRVRTMVRGQDERAVYHAAEDAFQDHYGFVAQEEEPGFRDFMHWIEKDPNHDPSLWFLAVTDGDEGEEIAGISLCTGKMNEDPDMAYVMELAVRRPWRRQGIALALLHHSFGEFRRRGKARATLHVDAQSLTGATRLYEKAGMHVDREYEEFSKVLREGEELSTQTLEE